MAEKGPEKVVTRYDRRMEARKREKEKEARENRFFHTLFVVLCAGVVGGFLLTVAFGLYRRYSATHSAYVRIGDWELTEAQYGYYYKTTSDAFIADSSMYLSLLGLDTSRDFSDQPYTEDMTWKDFFDEQTVDALKRQKAVLDDAGAKGFAFDTQSGYDSFVTTMEQEASTAGESLESYYKTKYGKYATAEIVEPLVKRGLLEDAYYEELVSRNQPSDEDVEAYYQENRQSLDTVDYRVYTFKAPELGEDEERTDEEEQNIFAEMELQAKGMLSRLEEGEDFRELCAEYEGSDTGVDYLDEETDLSFSDDTSYSLAPAAIRDWLFDDAREEGDTAALPDEENLRYYVVRFIERGYDSSKDEQIASQLATEGAEAVLTELEGGLEVEDVGGDLDYIRIRAAQESEAAESAAGTAAGDEDTAEETPAAGDEGAAEETSAAGGESADTESASEDDGR